MSEKTEPLFEEIPDTIPLTPQLGVKLKLLDQNGKELPLDHMTEHMREQVNKLLNDYGYPMKKDKLLNDKHPT